MLFQREHIGCYKDGGKRAMPVRLAYTVNNLLESCTQAAIAQGYSVFGIQFNQECFSGPNAQHTYDKYGTSTHCSNGVGGSWSNDVYRVIRAGILTTLLQHNISMY